LRSGPFPETLEKREGRTVAAGQALKEFLMEAKPGLLFRAKARNIGSLENLLHLIQCPQMEKSPGLRKETVEASPGERGRIKGGGRGKKMGKFQGVLLSNNETIPLFSSPRSSCARRLFLHRDAGMGKMCRYQGEVGVAGADRKCPKMLHLSSAFFEQSFFEQSQVEERT
jgi:hypothetical protein